MMLCLVAIWLVIEISALFMVGCVFLVRRILSENFDSSIVDRNIHIFGELVNQNFREKFSLDPARHARPNREGRL